MLLFALDLSLKCGTPQWKWMNHLLSLWNMITCHCHLHCHHYQSILPLHSTATVADRIPDWVHNIIIGDWVIVQYDNVRYPDEVTNIKEDIQVNVMVQGNTHGNGQSTLTMYSINQITYWKRLVPHTVQFPDM